MTIKLIKFFWIVSFIVDVVFIVKFTTYGHKYKREYGDLEIKTEKCKILISIAISGVHPKQYVQYFARF